MYIISKYYNIYLNYILRYRLYKIKNIDDCIKILKSFTYIDDMLSNIINVYNIYPPTELEIQNISLLQQMYQYDNDINCFASTLLWSCIVQWIIENENQDKLTIKN